MIKVMNQKTFIIIAASLGLANCGQRPDYPNPAAQRNQINGTPQITNNAFPSRDKTDLTNTTSKNVVSTDQPKAPTDGQASTVTNTESTTVTPAPKNSVVRNDLTPFDWFRTSSNYTAQKTETIAAAPKVEEKTEEKVINTPVLTPIVTVTKTETKNTISNFFANDDSVKNVFEAFSNSKVDPAFSIDTYSELLSANALTIDQRDSILQKYFSIIESNDPSLKKIYPIDARVKDVFNSYSKNPNSRLDELILYRVDETIPEIKTLPASMLKSAYAMTYALILTDKVNRAYQGQGADDTNFSKSLKIVSDNNLDQSLRTNTVVLMSIDFSTTKMTDYENQMMGTFSRIVTTFKQPLFGFTNVKFTVVGHTQKLSSPDEAKQQGRQNADKVLTAFKNFSSSTFGDWQADSKGFEQLLNKNDPTNLKNKRVEIVMSSSEGN